MATWYLSTTASGTGDGSSWENAFTQESELEAVFSTGDVAYLDSNPEFPLRSMSFSSIDDAELIGSAGPNGQTYFTNAYKSAGWTSNGAYGWQLSGFSSKPAEVTYNWRLDDEEGSITGCSLSSRILKYYRKWGWINKYAYKGYGWLLEDTTTPTTPASGKWGYSGGVLYVNPPESDDQSTFMDLCEYYPNGVNGITFSLCENFYIHGGMEFDRYPGDASNSGYGIKGVSCTYCTIEDVFVREGGWHGLGIASDSGPGNIIRHCIVNGVQSKNIAMNSFVFTWHSSTGTPNFLGDDLVSILAPMALYPVDGKAAPRHTNTYVTHGLSHATDTTSDFNGGVWSKMLGWDWTKELEDFHSVTFTTNGTTLRQPLSPIGHSDGSIGDPWDIDTYPVKIYNSAFLGRSILSNELAWINCINDRETDGRGGSESGGHNLQYISGASTAINLNWKNCTVISGNYGRPLGGVQDLIGLIEDGSTIVMHGCKILLQSTNSNSSLFGLRADDLAVKNFLLTGNKIDCESTVNHYWYRATTNSPYDNNFSVIESGGNNELSLIMDGAGSAPLGGAFTRDIAWHQANITGGATDSQTDLNWGSTSSEKAEYLRNYWVENMADITTGYVAGWTGDGVLTDDSGNGNDLVSNNSAGYTDGLNGAQALLAVAASSRYFSAASFTSIDSQSKLIFSCHFKANSLGDFRSLGIKRSSDSARITIQSGGSGFGGNTSLLVALGNGGNSYAYTSSGLITAGEWYHLLVVYDGTQATALNRVRLYLSDETGFNSTPISWASSTGTFPTTTPNIAATPLWIGRQSAGNWDGAMQYIRFYTGRDMTTDEYRALYELGFPPEVSEGSDSRSQMNIGFSLGM